MVAGVLHASGDYLGPFSLELSPQIEILVDRLMNLFRLVILSHRLCTVSYYAHPYVIGEEIKMAENQGQNPVLTVN